MTKEEMQEIRERVEAATPGPWEVAIHRKVHGNLGPLDKWHGMGPNVSEKRAKRDAEFIAAARTDVLALLDEIEKLGKFKEKMMALGIEDDDE